MSQVRRRKVLLGAGALFAVPLVSVAQQLSKVRRIGFLGARSRSTPSNPDVYYDAFVQGMRDLGYVEGKNLTIEWRFADNRYERLLGLADEMVKMKVEVIVTHSVPAAQALKPATSTIPIVFAAAADPVGSGLVASLARPGGNITGLSNITADLAPKQFELLKTMTPALSRVAVLVNPGNTTHSSLLALVRVAANGLGVTLLPVEARTPEEIERGFGAMRQERADAVIVLGDTFFVGQRRQITKLAVKNQMPSVFHFREDTQAGGLMSYGPNLTDVYRRAAVYVDKILKGAKPADLPVEQPTRLELVINLKTANALGLKVPSSLLARADDVIQ